MKKEKEQELREIKHNVSSEVLDATDYYNDQVDSADKARETYKLWISLNPFNFKDLLKSEIEPN